MTAAAETSTGRSPGTIPKPAREYGSGWQKEVVANVHIDNHVSAVSDGEFIYAVVKDDQDAIWLLKGHPGNWDNAYLVVDGSTEDPSRPTVVLDDTHDQLYIFYQQQTSVRRHLHEARLYARSDV